MNNILRYAAVLAVLPLFVFALQSGGHLTETHAQGGDDICGVQFCSEIEGGRDAWLAQLPNFASFSDDDDDMMEEVTDMADDDTTTGTMPAEPATESAPEPATDTATDTAPGLTLALSRANIPVEIPMDLGFYNGEYVYFITTDSSDAEHGELIANSTGWKVEYSPLLATTPSGFVSNAYFIENGPITDEFPTGEYTVFTNTPAQVEEYTALVADIHIVWVDDATPRLLTSEAEILSAMEAGEVRLGDGILGDGSVILNTPQIVWPEGQMQIKESADDPSYGGGQVTDIDTEEMTVTFIAHRGWGPDGRTIYYIVTDATPSGPANGMGVVYSPKSGDLLVNSAAVDLFQFTNGIKGTGPLGFQPGIASGALGDDNYSPMWRIYLVEWNNPEDAQLLETIGDINAFNEAGLITVSLARPMDSDHIVNCPFVDPFQ